MCGGKFFPKSLPFHQKSCAKKSALVELPCPHCDLPVPKSELNAHIAKCPKAPKMPKPKGGAKGAGRGAEPQLEEIGLAPNADGLIPCQVCGRTFLPDRIAKHQGICRKVGAKKRKKFDDFKQRKVDGMMHRVNPAKEPHDSGVSSKWREESEQFRAAMKAAREAAAGLPPSSPPPQPQRANPRAGGRPMGVTGRGMAEPRKAAAPKPSPAPPPNVRAVTPPPASRANAQRSPAVERGRTPPPSTGRQSQPIRANKQDPSLSLGPPAGKQPISKSTPTTPPAAARRTRTPPRTPPPIQRGPPRFGGGPSPGRGVGPEMMGTGGRVGFGGGGGGFDTGCHTSLDNPLATHPLQVVPHKELGPVPQMERIVMGSGRAGPPSGGGGLLTTNETSCDNPMFLGYTGYPDKSSGRGGGGGGGAGGGLPNFGYARGGGRVGPPEGGFDTGNQTSMDNPLMTNMYQAAAHPTVSAVNRRGQGGGGGMGGGGGFGGGGLDTGNQTSMDNPLMTNMYQAAPHPPPSAANRRK
ncbi:unnamed protein product [Vitrella brassicaformis CCMP3155]|uniref:C2HC/C3H-type domain-containing protein n=1 Tax=Vitrella brassicaformis (strain CCMP3155) TaxID=1169540 RepID=A0A0G4GXX5_VITBC|nr:unnamed protein product [Vitrella brassicaformis CCMP3155]|eukprot:CEM35957.1 unnamed protein product [Vitrella brassicaformis CCMP3155]